MNYIGSVRLFLTNSIFIEVTIEYPVLTTLDDIKVIAEEKVLNDTGLSFHTKDWTIVGEHSK